MRTNEITGIIVDSAIKVHSALGPGLLESAYEACLARELLKRGLRVRRQVELPVLYDGERIDIGYRLDLLVEDAVIVEVKTIEQFAPIHKAQVLTYLRLTGLHCGVLINFNVVHLRDGIKRIIRGGSPADDLKSSVSSESSAVIS